MSICLAVVAATVLSAAATTPTAAPTLLVPAGPQAVQYVQVQYRNVLKNSGFGGTASQALGNPIKPLIGSFVRNVLQSALSHVNPILGFIANQIANRMTKRLTAPPIDMHPKPDVNIVAEFEATTTIGPARTRTDVGDISTIVECDKQQIIVMDNTAKVYSAQSFDDSVKDADASQAPAFFGGGAPDVTQQTVVAQPDDGTETIAGLLSHHQLISAPSTTGFGSAKTDFWFADVPMPNACSSAPPQTSVANPQPAAVAPSTVRIPLRSVQWSQMDFAAPPATPSPSPDASASPTPYEDPVLQTPGIAWLETTSVTRLPYDSSYFDVPAGYTLAAPEPSPSPS
jgi:hypothetical protein